MDKSVQLAIEEIERLTASHGCYGRPTGSPACECILKAIHRGLDPLCERIVRLPEGAGIVCTVSRGDMDIATPGVLVMSHVDFHPLQRQRVLLSMEPTPETTLHRDYAVDRCYDNTGGIAILLRVAAAAYKQLSYSSGPLHLAFLTGGDSYTATDTAEDPRRVNGHGPRHLVTWLERSNERYHLSCAISVYASIYEPCQREFELSAVDSDCDMSFHCFHIVGAGYALGTLTVGLDPNGGRLTVNLPGESPAPRFDTVFLRAYNHSQTAFPVTSNGRFVSYIVPRCQPPIADTLYFTLGKLGVPLVRVDAPLMLSDSGSPFEAVQDMICKSVLEIMAQPLSEHSFYFDLGDEREETEQQQSGLFTHLSTWDRDHDLEFGESIPVAAESTPKGGCQLQ